MRLVLPFLACFSAAVATYAASDDISEAKVVVSENPPTLSEFGFFDGSVARPSKKLIPYELRTPLFSDYATKQRFIFLPAGANITADKDGRLIFPVGAALIKSFGYPAASGGLDVIETRVLLHKASGWVALPYVWRKDRSDADLRVGGTRIPVVFDRNGTKTSISYSVPNKNQCKQCHSVANDIMPIGPVWQNMNFTRDGDRQRLSHMLPTLAQLPSFAVWDKGDAASLDERAKQYLNINCGHCHAPKGSASNSGLFLDGSSRDPVAMGMGKRPVAAGRASGDLDFIIAPGQPERSILVKRMESTDPGIAMPELGRATVHEEGVDLIRDWIASMPTTGH
ncbi:SO2930 family diheme c-type cytochrome [Sphingorhabdus sp.]|uniref:SO2930 family diheme c-type cytochrome n=1 Tax=Sphingorhabdus sp. TaxID=1902408 RepID=UPI00391A1D4B